MGDKEWTPRNILDVFGDRIARATLVLAKGQPMSARDIADALDVSTPTIYRRVDPLVEANLLQEHQRVDRNGNQPTEYEAKLDKVVFEVEQHGYTIDIQVQQDLSDDFGAMWNELEQLDWRTDSSQTGHSFHPGNQNSEST